MKKTLNKLLFFILLFSLLPITPKIGVYFLSFNSASAIEINYPTLFGITLSGSSPITDFVAYFFNIAMSIAGLLAMLSIIFGAISWTYSYGMGKTSHPGKDRMISGVLGMILLLSSYLLATTINPDLGQLKIESLFRFIPGVGTTVSPINNLPPSTAYNEIPIGTLTENVLARSMDCFAYDQVGEPIDGKPSTSSILEPGLIDHDRIDCLIKLGEAIEKKSNIFSKLSQEITTLMNTCKCDGTKCKQNCTTCTYPGDAQQEGACNPASCEGDCVNSSCIPNAGQSCCSASTKQKIDKGPITIKLQTDCDTPEPPAPVFHVTEAPKNWTADGTNWVGPDGYTVTPDAEVYNNEDIAIGVLNPTSNLVIEAVSGNIVAMIDSDGKMVTDPTKLPTNYWIKGMTDWSSAEGYNLTADGQVFDTSDTLIGTWSQYTKTIRGTDGKIVASLKNGAIYFWPKVNLTFKGMTEFKSKYPNADGTTNLDLLLPAVELNISGLTVIKKSAWKLLPLIDKIAYYKKKIEQIDLQADLLNLIRGKEEVNQCYNIKTSVEFLQTATTTDKNILRIQTPPNKTFADPITSLPIDSARYCKGYQYLNSDCFSTCQKKCPGINPISFKSIKDCTPDDSACIENAFYKCPSDSEFPSFQECVSSCRTDCKQNGECAKNCDNNSKCLMDNSEKCYINYASLQACASIKRCSGTNNSCQDDRDCDQEQGESCIPTTYEEFQLCAKDTFKCRFCTDQQSEYPDCYKDAPTSWSSFFDFLGNPDYSYSFLFFNPDKEKCPVCTATNGVAQYPQCAKCPSCSNCPTCPCAQEIIGNVNTAGVCSGQCDEFSYNDDPLTFYCLNNWAPDLTKTGVAWTCPINNEIPIGQTVDEAILWAKGLNNPFHSFIQTTQDLLDYLNKIGTVENYCACDSKCGDKGKEGEKICGGDCTLNDVLVPPQEVPAYVDPDTGDYFPPYTIPAYHSCSCQTKPCSGGPCLKMTNLFMGKTASAACETGVANRGVDWFHTELQKKLEDLLPLLEVDRSDILKKLTYSRKTINSCSAQTEQFGQGASRPLDCTQAYSTTGIFQKRCYGVINGLAQTPPIESMDNWFCCQNVSGQQ